MTQFPLLLLATVWGRTPFPNTSHPEGLTPHHHHTTITNHQHVDAKHFINQGNVMLLLSWGIFHEPESVTEVMDVVYSHPLVHPHSVQRGASTHITTQVAHPRLPTHMSSVERCVMPMQRACCFPSAMIACNVQTLLREITFSLSCLGIVF